MRPGYLLVLRRIGRRVFPKRADMLGREQGQAIMRVSVSLVVPAYLLFHQRFSSFGDGNLWWLGFLVAFPTLSGVLAVATLRARRYSPYRRVLANLADVAAVTFVMSVTAEAGVPAFVIYLWVTLGNGFRFGLVPMAISAVLSMVGFAIVMSVSDFWRLH